MSKQWDMLMTDLWNNTSRDKQLEIIHMIDSLNKENVQVMMKTKNQITTVKELEMKLKELLANQQ